MRPRLAALRRFDHTRTVGPATALRLRLLDERAEAIATFDARDREITRELAALIEARGSTLDELAASQPVLSPSSWSRSATPVASLRAASPASTGPRPYLPPQEKEMTGRAVIV